MSRDRARTARVAAGSPLRASRYPQTTIRQLPDFLSYRSHDYRSRPHPARGAGLRAVAVSGELTRTGGGRGGVAWIQGTRMVPRKGLEPSRPLSHWHLKPARLPIPPPGLRAGYYGSGARLSNHRCDANTLF